MARVDRAAQLLGAAKKQLAFDASVNARERIEKRLETICTELVGEWLTGERRFESPSQQAEHWIARIYEEIFEDEQPDATRLYMRFQLPLPRAHYVTRLMLARRTAQWRSAAREEILRVLASVEKKAKEAADAGEDQTQRFDLSVSRGGYDELMVVFDSLARGLKEANRPTPPAKKPSTPTLIWFSITAEAVIALLGRLRLEAKP